MLAWAQPYCGAEFGGKVAGHAVVCDLEVHAASVPHRETATGFEWWGAAGYPRSAGR